jgi:hypothetical protein
MDQSSQWSLNGDESGRLAGGVADPPGVRWRDFRRGFIEAIEVDNLRHLHLSNNTIGTEGARALASSTSLRSLRQVDLHHTEVWAAAQELWQRFGGQCQLQ